MPEQQPDKRCSTCSAWTRQHWHIGRCAKHSEQRTADKCCSFWTPKPKREECPDARG